MRIRCEVYLLYPQALGNHKVMGLQTHWIHLCDRLGGYRSLTRGLQNHPVFLEVHDSVWASLLTGIPYLTFIGSKYSIFSKYRVTLADVYRSLQGRKEVNIYLYCTVLHCKSFPQKDLASPSNKAIWICELTYLET